MHVIPPSCALKNGCVVTFMLHAFSHNSKKTNHSSSMHPGAHRAQRSTHQDTPGRPRPLTARSICLPGRLAWAWPGQRYQAREASCTWALRPMSEIWVLHSPAKGHHSCWGLGWGTQVSVPGSRGPEEPGSEGNRRRGADPNVTCSPGEEPPGVQHTLP